jgi:hypothetical protein
LSSVVGQRDGMTRYERTWTVIAGGVCAAALVAAFQKWTVVVLLCTALAVGVMGALLVLSFVIERDAWLWPTVKAVPYWGLGAWVVMGLGRLAGPAALATGALLAVVAPASIDGYAALANRLGVRRPARRRRRSSDHDTAIRSGSVTPVAGGMSLPVDPLSDETVLDVPDTMTDTDLCQAWRSSFVALERAQSVQARAQVVQLRALYLDELERRAGDAVNAWLASGARAASDPGRFVLGYPASPRPPTSAAEQPE